MGHRQYKIQQGNIKSNEKAAALDSKPVNYGWSSAQKVSLSWPAAFFKTVSIISFILLHLFNKSCFKDAAISVSSSNWQLMLLFLKLIIEKHDSKQLNFWSIMFFLCRGWSVNLVFMFPRKKNISLCRLCFSLLTPTLIQPLNMLTVSQYLTYLVPTHSSMTQRFDLIT